MGTAPHPTTSPPTPVAHGRAAVSSSLTSRIKRGRSEGSENVVVPAGSEISPSIPSSNAREKPVLWQQFSKRSRIPIEIIDQIFGYCDMFDTISYEMPRDWLTEIDPVAAVYSAPEEVFSSMRISKEVAKRLKLEPERRRSTKPAKGWEMGLKHPVKSMKTRKGALVFAFLCRVRPDLITLDTVKNMVTLGSVPFVSFLCRTNHKVLDLELVAVWAFNTWYQKATKDPTGDYSETSNHVIIVEAIRMKGYPVCDLPLLMDFTPLYLAAQVGGYEMCHVLVRSGANLEKGKNKALWQPPLLVTLPDPDGQPRNPHKGDAKPRKGAAKVVHFLLKMGSVADVANSNGTMLIHRAAWCSASDICTELLERKIDVNAADNFGRTPLHFLACAPNPEDAIALAAAVDTYLVLVRYGANLTSITTGDPRTPQKALAIGGPKTPLEAAEIVGNHIVAALLYAYLEAPYLAGAGAGTGIGSDAGKTQQYEACARYVFEKWRKITADEEAVKDRKAMALSRACLGILKVLFGKGVSAAKLRVSENTSALFAAALHGDAEMCEILLTAGANVNDGERDSSTTPIMATLPDPNDKNLRSGALEVFWLLFEKITLSGLPLKDRLTLFHRAAAYHLAAVCQALSGDTKAGEPNGPFDRTMGFDLKEPDKSGRNALHFWALRPDPEGPAENEEAKKTLLLLLQLGVNVSARDADGSTALHLAARQGSSNLCRMLLSLSKAFQVEFEVKNNYEETPLLAAVPGTSAEGRLQSKRAYETVAALLHFGSDLNAQDLTGATLLHRAAAVGSLPISQLALSRGAKFSRDKHNMTPLDWALKAIEEMYEPHEKSFDVTGFGIVATEECELRFKAYGDVIKLLAPLSPDHPVKLADEKHPILVRPLLCLYRNELTGLVIEGKSPIWYAVRHTVLDVIRHLDFDVNAAIDNSTGNTPLHEVFRWASLSFNSKLNDFIDVLVSREADPLVRNAAGVTPLEVAAESPVAGTIQMSSPFAKLVDALKEQLHWRNGANVVVLMKLAHAVSSNPPMRNVLETALARNFKLETLVDELEAILNLPVDHQDHLKLCKELAKLNSYYMARTMHAVADHKPRCLQPLYSLLKPRVNLPEHFSKFTQIRYGAISAPIKSMQDIEKLRALVESDLQDRLALLAPLEDVFNKLNKSEAEIQDLQSQVSTVEKEQKQLSMFYKDLEITADADDELQQLEEKILKATTNKLRLERLLRQATRKASGIRDHLLPLKDFIQFLQGQLRMLFVCVTELTALLEDLLAGETGGLTLLERYRRMQVQGGSPIDMLTACTLWISEPEMFKKGFLEETLNSDAMTETASVKPDILKPSNSDYMSDVEPTETNMERANEEARLVASSSSAIPVPTSAVAQWNGSINPNDIEIQHTIAVDRFSNIEGGRYKDLNVIVKRSRHSTENHLIQREIDFLRKASSNEFIVSFCGWFEELGTGVMGLVVQRYTTNLRDWSSLAAPSADLEAKMLKISEGVTKGLAHIHTLDIVHNNLKPRNVFVDLFDKPFIGCFGAATNHGEALMRDPGQYFDKESLNFIPDELSDSWLLGVTLWEFWSNETFSVEREISLDGVRNDTIKDGLSGLQYACRNNLADAVKMLLEFGADHQRQDESGRLPIQLSASVVVWREFLPKMKPRTWDIFLAAKIGDDVSVRLILAAENPRGKLMQRTEMELGDLKRTVTPLHVAAFEGNATLCKVFLEFFADINGRDDRMWTPLFFAVTAGQLDVTRFLIEKGTDIEARSTDGKTALHEAAFRGNTEVVRLLLEFGADINARDNRMWTPLFFSVTAGRLDVTRCLIEKGADMEARSTDGKTAFHEAALRGHTEVVHLLVEKGAHNGGSSKEETPLIADPTVDLPSQYRDATHVIGAKRALASPNDSGNANDTSEQTKRARFDSTTNDGIGRLNVLAEAAGSTQPAVNPTWINSGPAETNGMRNPLTPTGHHASVHASIQYHSVMPPQTQFSLPGTMPAPAPATNVGGMPSRAPFAVPPSMPPFAAATSVANTELHAVSTLGYSAQPPITHQHQRPVVNPLTPAPAAFMSAPVMGSNKPQEQSPVSHDLKIIKKGTPLLLLQKRTKCDRLAFYLEEARKIYWAERRKYVEADLRQTQTTPVTEEDIQQELTRRWDGLLQDSKDHFILMARDAEAPGMSARSEHESSPLPRTEYSNVTGSGLRTSPPPQESTFVAPEERVELGHEEDVSSKKSKRGGNWKPQNSREEMIFQLRDVLFSPHFQGSDAKKACRWTCHLCEAVIRPPTPEERNQIPKDQTARPTLNSRVVHHFITEHADETSIIERLEIPERKNWFDRLINSMSKDGSADLQSNRSLVVEAIRMILDAGHRASTLVQKQP
ncbi:hypothetical protein HDU96_006488 [Phlyctochytrium bullatum]|nr:hypothetical protein HDU96_006488 [Phlyctochytrium bullatum]